MKWTFLAVIILFLGQSVTGQEEMKSDSSRPFIRKSSFVVLPLAFYTPETRFGGGAATLYAFRFRNQPDSTRPSQFQLGGAYTQENQLLTYLPFQIFLKDRTYNIYGEVGYYRYFFYFYGIGNDIPNVQERYSVRFPRVRLNFLKMVYPNLSLGVRYWMDDFNITEVDPNGLLADGTIRGSQGSFISSLGLVANYDTRDNIFYATEGWNVEAVLLNNSSLWGSDFNFNRFTLDATTYLENRMKHVVALNAFMNFNFGDVPFNEMAVIGGTKKMRGFFEGRFRDNHVWMMQGAYRIPKVWWRFGLEFFGSVGSTAHQIPDFFDNQIHYSGGMGLRFALSPKEKINIRIDYGINDEGQGFPYITVTEAF